MRRLIFVHGINNQDLTKAQIETSWSKSFRDTLGRLADAWWDDVEIRTAYYADVLYKEEQSWESGAQAVAAMAVGGPDSDYAPNDLAALYLELQRAHGITDAQVEAELRPGEQAQANRMAAGIHKSWLKAITRALEKVIPGAAGGLAEKFLRQAATYLNKPGVYDKINTLVRGQVFDNLVEPQRTVIVSHSLGTIVSYVLLRQMPDAPQLPLFVTLGSPLGIRIVRDRIQPPYITPPIASIWLNGSDKEDFVALQPGLTADTFGKAKVTNIATLDNGYEDAHSIEKYLAQPAIALAIGQALV
ncbi:hypothetical protein CK228_27780 [Mesorhizobium sp. WSM4312]|uniref:hypothetical protein n=1 Tax=Mesorhizobium sp. WSM4312 TaxID=2029411 RepID=UPI000BB00896|nr:hypothetical protein [Mesorhizobium sp. WSM4312]PBB65510.1 hypothetical protein CK228_27780 [Mesorhizobium sp. WSM4312]